MGHQFEMNSQAWPNRIQGSLFKREEICCLRLNLRIYGVHISYERLVELGNQLILYLNGLVFDARMMRAWFGIAARLVRRYSECTFLTLYTELVSTSVTF